MNQQRTIWSWSHSTKCSIKGYISLFRVAVYHSIATAHNPQSQDTLPCASLSPCRKRSRLQTWRWSHHPASKLWIAFQMRSKRHNDHSFQCPRAFPPHLHSNVSFLHYSTHPCHPMSTQPNSSRASRLGLLQVEEQKTQANDATTGLRSFLWEMNPAQVRTLLDSAVV